MYDADLTNYRRMDGETGDAPRIQRAINATGNGVLMIPKGIYRIASPLMILNKCSLVLHSSAKLLAVCPMDFVLTYDGGEGHSALAVYDDDGQIFDNLNLFIKGGDIDGNGLASCLRITNAHHFTLKDISLHNGKQYGLCVGGGRGHLYELIATNVYCKCTLAGLAGNTGIYTDLSDSHYVDCIVVDYTVGIESRGSSNRFTRCHVWGGIIPPKGYSQKEWSDLYQRRKENPGEDQTTWFDGRIPEMLKNSICFHMIGAGNNLTDCYADTAKIGYRIHQDTFLSNCGAFNNTRMGLTDLVIIEHLGGMLSVLGCYFRQCSKNEILYQGIEKDVLWQNNVVRGFLPPEQAKSSG